MKYTMKKVSDKMNGGEKKKLYPKMERYGLVEMKQLVRYIESSSSLSEGDVKGVLAALTDAAITYMSVGHSVKIEGLGILSPRLGLKDENDSERGDEGEVRHYGQSVEVTGIHLKPDPELLQKFNLHCRPQRIEAVSTDFAPEHSTIEERRKAALQYLKEHGEMSIHDYASITRLPYTTAGRELRKWKAEEGSSITSRHIGRNIFYLIRKSEP